MSATSASSVLCRVSPGGWLRRSRAGRRRASAAADLARRRAPRGASGRRGRHAAAATAGRVRRRPATEAMRCPSLASSQAGSPRANPESRAVIACVLFIGMGLAEPGPSSAGVRTPPILPQQAVSCPSSQQRPSAQWSTTATAGRRHEGARARLGRRRRLPAMELQLRAVRRATLGPRCRRARARRARSRFRATAATGSCATPRPTSRSRSASARPCNRGTVRATRRSPPWC